MSYPIFLENWEWLWRNVLRSSVCFHHNLGRRLVFLFVCFKVFSGLTQEYVSNSQDVTQKQQSP